MKIKQLYSYLHNTLINIFLLQIWDYFCPTINNKKMATNSIMVNFLTANGNKIECFDSISQMIAWIKHPLNNTFYNIIYDIEFIKL